MQEIISFKYFKIFKKIHMFQAETGAGGASQKQRFRKKNLVPLGVFNAWTVFLNIF